MKSRKYYGKKIDFEKLEQNQHIFLPDDYDLPCYRFFFNDDKGYGSYRGEGFYYIEIMVNEEGVIKSIERFRDIYSTNYEQKIMCNSAEHEAEKLLDDLTCTEKNMEE